MHSYNNSKDSGADSSDNYSPYHSPAGQNYLSTVHANDMKVDITISNLNAKNFEKEQN